MPRTAFIRIRNVLEMCLLPSQKLLKHHLKRVGIFLAEGQVYKKATQWRIAPKGPLERPTHISTKVRSTVIVTEITFTNVLKRANVSDLISNYWACSTYNEGTNCYFVMEL